MVRSGYSCKSPHTPSRECPRARQITRTVRNGPSTRRSSRSVAEQCESARPHARPEPRAPRRPAVEPDGGRRSRPHPLAPISTPAHMSVVCAVLLAVGTLNLVAVGLDRPDVALLTLGPARSIQWTMLVAPTLYIHGSSVSAARGEQAHVRHSHGALGPAYGLGGQLFGKVAEGEGH